MADMEDAGGKEQTCSRIIQTACVIWALVMVGISDSLLGPSLLDLQALLLTDLGSLNYIILATGFCDFVGAILAGLLTKTANVHLRLSVSVFLGALAIGLSAIIASYYYVLVVFSLQGLLRGIVYCYSIEKGYKIWRNKGVSFQLLVLGPTLGGILSPLIINLFLCSPTEQPDQLEVMLHNTSNTSSVVTPVNVTMPYVLNGTSTNATEPTLKCLPEDVKIAYAYIILGIICIPPVLGFFIYWISLRSTPSENTDDTATVVDYEIESNVQHKRQLKILFSVLFVIYYFPLLGANIMYSTFLTEFGVKGSLHLEKASMVLMTSLYWGCSLFGRIVNIFLTPWLGVEQIIIVNIISLLICETILISSVSQSEIVLWACTCAIGLFVAPYVGTGYAWCADHIELEPRIIASSSASLGLGGMAIPFIGGLLFQNYGPMSFLYFFYANYLFVAVVLCVLFVLGRKLKQQHSMSVEVNLDPSAEPLKVEEGS